MKFALVSLLVGYAAAFAPASQKASTSALQMSAYSGEVGAQPPTGFFDPLKLSNGISPERFDLYRRAELKHGRVAMLAVVGYVVPEFYRFPGEVAYGLKFADVPNGLAAIEAVPALGWAQIVAAVGSVEFSKTLGDFEIGKPDFSPDILASRQAQELTHGRLAMIATLELLRHDRYDEVGELIRGFPFLYS
jgi:Chlorophyll A-B binding protein